MPLREFIFDNTKSRVFKKITAEKTRLIQKLLGEKRSGMPMGRPMPSFQTILTCGDHEHEDHMATIYENQNN